MRITNTYIYSQNINNYQRQQSNMNDLYGKASNEMKINHAYDNASIYSEGARLVYELSTFEQIKDAASKAVNITKNSDKTIDEIGKSLEQFKNKLLQGANEVHSETSLNALANDLEQIKKHIVNLANTSINGQFLFSGTSVSTKPFDEKGNYYGNDENMKVILGSNIYTDYNISGKELMKGVDNDYKKIVSTNVRMVDRRYDIKEPDQVHYITPDNKIQDLIGKEYLKKGAKPELNVNDHFLKNDGARLPDTYFYIRGTTGNGESFKAKFSMGPKENVSALLNKIGELYGNTEEVQLVDVRINNSGNIEITDLKNPESKLNFSMFAATAKADDFTQIYPPEPPTQAQIDEVNDIIAYNQQIIDDAAALGQQPDPALLKPVPQLPIVPLPVNDKRASVVDPSELRNNENVFVLDFTNTGNVDITDVSDGVDYSRSQFAKKDNVLSSNISQVDKNKNIATNETKLINASLGEINLDPNTPVEEHSILQIEITSKSQTHYTIDFDITSGTVTANYEDAQGQAQTRTIPLTNVVYDNNQHKSDSMITKNSDITFKQLGDIISLFATDNIPTNDYAPVEKYPGQPNSPMILEEDDHNELQRLLEQASNMVDVGLDERGRLNLTDKIATTTNIELAIFDKKTMYKTEIDVPDPNDPTQTIKVTTDGEFYFGVDANGDLLQTGKKQGDLFNFNTNSTLIIDENHIDIIKDLDKMIEAVRNGEYRSNNEKGELLKTVGIQGALKRIDHLQDHINKVHTKIGSAEQSITTSQERAESMFVNVQEVKNSVIKMDPSEAIMALKQAEMVFQSTLQASMMISKLSLLNYM